MSDWHDATLRDEIELAYGKALPAHKRSEGSVEVFGSNGVVGTNATGLLEGPGIVVGRKGSVGAVVYSESSYWPIDTAYYVVNKKNHNWRYLYYLLQSSGLSGMNSHSAVPGLNRDDVYSLSVRIPNREIQDKIARVLDLLGESVDTERSLLETTRRLKEAVAFTLFSQGMRQAKLRESEIGPIPEEWDLVPMGTLGKIGNGSTPKRSNPLYWNGGTFPWLTSAKVYDREIVAANELVTKAALDECHLPIVRPGAVLVAITGQGKTLGNCAVLRVDATINQHIAYLQTDTEQADPGFVRGYLETRYEYLRQVGSGGGSTKGALTCAFLRGMSIPLPPLPEQHDIVAVLDAIDAKVDLHVRHLEVLEAIRGSITTQLVSGALTLEDLDLTVLGVSEEKAA